ASTRSPLLSIPHTPASRPEPLGAVVAAAWLACGLWQSAHSACRTAAVVASGILKRTESGDSDASCTDGVTAYVGCRYVLLNSEAMFVVAPPLGPWHPSHAFSSTPFSMRLALLAVCGL